MCVAGRARARACVCVARLRNLVGVGEKEGEGGKRRWVGVYRLISDMCMRAGTDRQPGKRGKEREQEA